ncbi:MAG: FliM/FliN family flagellar motor C-terminal domain-containing protein [Hyphomonas sp.]
MPVSRRGRAKWIPLCSSLSPPITGQYADRDRLRRRQSPWSPRHLTPLDGALLEGLVRADRPGHRARLRFAGVEIDVSAAALARPGSAEIIDFDVRVESGTFAARLILAGDGLFDDPPAEAPAVALAAPKAAPAAAQGNLTVVLTARVASLSVPLSRLSDLTPGSTLLLGVPADQPVELLSGGRDGPVVAEGQIGRKGNRMALKITRRSACF